ncbi:MAG: LytTR family transcriptional regulator [Chitinophagaceae bacterium]|nr:LytTR family transcriptional regulator [Chitinophagaceae bacterium]
MNIFGQPFPHNSSWQNGLKIAAGFGAFITIFLLVFRPFELDKIPTPLLIKSSIIFGLITFSCIFGSNFFLNLFFPQIFNEEKWTSGKQIINMGAIVILVGLVNYLISSLLFHIQLTWKNVFYYQGIAISVGLLPIIIYTLYSQNHWLQQFKREAATLQKKLEQKKGSEQTDSHKPASAQNGEITFESDHQTEKKTIDADHLFYIEAASNYIKIFFEQKGKLTYSVIRMTMNKATTTVYPYSLFFRCHRAYIVNLDKIEQVEGNAQGYKLKLQGTTDLIPVSRNLNSEFSDRLLAFRRQTHL